MIQHLFPDQYTNTDVELTLLVPALNEEITIGEFVEWCKLGLKELNIRGQILIIDSSTDQTAEIALAHGAEVLKVPKQGLGRAYIDAIPYVNSRFIIMGDVDLTYDFRCLKPFWERFQAGSEFIMGSRFKGSIEKNAMPKLHQYFGTPITTWILNKVYGCHFSDIHCGMRGVTLDGLKRMKIKSQSWQYASEMIIKSLHLNLRTTEVPVNFYKDRNGRQSHHKRIGWYAPWHAGWINLKSIFIFGADFFLYKLGLLMTLIGLSGITILFNGPILIGYIGLNLHWMLLFALIFLVGLQFVLMGILAKSIYYLEVKRDLKWNKIFSLDIVTPISLIMTTLGILCMYPLLDTYLKNDLRLSSTLGVVSYHTVGGICIILSSIIYFTSSLIFNAVSLNSSDVKSPRDDH